MGKEKVQVGWKFEGADIVTANYRKEHFFTTIETDGTTNRMIITKERRNIGWEKEGREKPDQIFDVSASIGTAWEFTGGEEIPEQFEIARIERLNGRTTTTMLKAEPLIEEIEIEIEQREEEG